MKSFTPTPNISNSRAFLASLLTCILLMAPLTPLEFAATNTSRLSQAKNTKQQPSSAKSDAPANDAVVALKKDPPALPQAVAITATKDDGRTAAQPASPGDIINYTVTITNNGSTDATGVVFNDTIDGNTTLVPNSIAAQPQARNDAYTAVGNTLLEAGLAAPSGNPAVTSTVKVFDNDAVATDSFTLSTFQNPSAQGGTVTLNADGSFSYLPAVGFTGTDTFTYTIRSTVNTALTDTATVTITVSNRVWYVNNAAAAGGDGRSNAPFQTLAPVNGAGGAGDSDATGDYIYLFTGNATYTTGLALENTQQFIGNGVALIVGGNTLRAAGTRPTLSNTGGNALTLANDTSTQGLNISAASNAAIFGSGVSGVINVSDANVATSGSGTGVSLTNQAGTFNYSGGGGSSITGNSSGTAVLISTGNGNITFSGIPISQNGGRAIDIQTRTGGTVSFENGSTVTETAGSTDAVVLRNNTGGSVINFQNNVNLTTTAGRGLQTDNSTGSFTLNMNAAGNTINATGGAAIDVEDIAADLDFVTLASTNSTAQGVRIFNLSNTPAGRSVTVTTSTTVTGSASTGVLVDSNAAAVSLAALTSTPAANQIALSIVSNTGTVSTSGGSLSTTDAVALNVSASPINLTFGTVTADNTGDPDSGINLSSATGSLTANGGTLTGGSFPAFNVVGGTVSSTFSGNISQATNAATAALVSVSGGHATGTLTFQTGTLNATSGSGLQFDNADGTYNFNGTNTLNGGDAGVDILNNSSGTISFSNNTSITNPSGTAFRVDTSAPTVTYNGNITKNTGSGLLVDVTGQTGGTVTFQTGTLAALAGTGIQLSNADGTVNFNGTNTLNGGDAGVDILNGSSGTFNFSSNTTITSPTGTAFNVASTPGAPNVDYNGTITQNTSGQRVVNIDTTTGGSITFDGTVTGGASSTGININAASGSVTFTALVTLGTSAARATNQAVTIAGGSGAKTFGAISIFTSAAQGIVSTTTTGAITVASGTIDTTNAAAVNIAGTSSVSTTPLNIQLTTVNVAGGNVAPNGIVLTNTSTTGSPGGFRILGNTSGNCGGTTGGNPTAVVIAANAADCSGGRIQQTTGADNATTGTAVRLTNAAGVSLTRMRLDNHSNFAVRGDTVSGFSLINSLIEGTNGTLPGGDNQESSVLFNQLTGTSVIDNCTIRGGLANNIQVDNQSGTLNLTVTDSLIRDTSNASGEEGILLEAETTANVTVDISRNVFANEGGEHVQINAINNAILNITFANNTTTGGHASGIAQSGIFIFGSNYDGGAAAQDLSYSILNNNISGAPEGGLIHVNKGLGSATFGGTISGNTLSNSATSSGIRVESRGTGGHNAVVTNNTISQVNNIGILFEAGEGSSAINGTATGNTISNPGANALHGLYANIGTIAGDTNAACMDWRNNTLTNAANEGNGGSDIRLRQRFNSQIRLPGYAGPGDGSGIPAFMTGTNGNAATTITPSSTLSNFTGGAACTQPSAPLIVSPDKIGDESANNAPAAPAQTAQPSGITSGAPLVSLPAQPIQNTTAPGLVQTAGQMDAPPAPEQQQQAAVKAESKLTSKISAAQDEAQTSKTKERKGDTVQPLASSFPVNIGTLAAGDSVTITFSVMVKNPLSPANTTQVSNQGMVSGSNFANILTDDPQVAGTANPTVTGIQPPPTITINDASVSEPASGSANMPFTVVLSNPTSSTVSVNFATTDGTATSGMGGDYTSTSGTLTFAPGETLQTISVPVLSDSDTGETDENFTVTLSTAVNGLLGADVTATGTIKVANPPGTVLISELRSSGPSGSNDEFVELYNNTDATIDISGWALVTSGAACGGALNVVAVVPASTTIPARGHYLITGTAYSLPVAGDLAMVNPAAIDDDANVGIFDTSNVVNFSTATRRDAVGFGTNGLGNCALLREGSTLPAANSSTSQYSFVRSLTSGTPKDTGDNAADFILVSTTPGTAIGANAVNLGAPGPETRTSPVQRNSTIKSSLFDPSAAANGSPNRVRSGTGANPTNAAFGTLDIRRKFTNTTGAAITSLRFRVVDMTTRTGASAPPAGTADLRLLSSTNITVNAMTVNGTTVDLPAQPNGGGLNSSATVALPGGMLANGASVNLHFLLGVQQDGNFRFLVNVEALPGPAGETPPVDENRTTLKNGASGKPNQ